MRTNIVIDDELLEEAMRLLNVHTKKAAVELALKQLVKLEKRKEIRKLRGSINWDPDYDYKSLRK